MSVRDSSEVTIRALVFSGTAAKFPVWLSKLADSGPDPHMDEQPPEDNSGSDMLTFATNHTDSESIPPAHLARMMLARSVGIPRVRAHQVVKLTSL
jgi:hypothetical protein